MVTCKMQVNLVVELFLHLYQLVVQDQLLLLLPLILILIDPLQNFYLYKQMQVMLDLIILNLHQLRLDRLTLQKVPFTVLLLFQPLTLCLQFFHSIIHKVCTFLYTTTTSCSYCICCHYKFVFRKSCRYIICSFFFTHRYKSTTS